MRTETPELGAGKMDGAAARRYVLAGNATVTVRSRATGKRFTYKVRRPRADSPHFVRVLNCAENEAPGAFLGTIFDGRTYRHGRRSGISADAPSAKAFAWLWPRLGEALPASVEVWHEGHCGRCGRLLTVPESIAGGIGPKCLQIIAREGYGL